MGGSSLIIAWPAMFADLTGLRRFTAAQVQLLGDIDLSLCIRDAAVHAEFEQSLKGPGIWIGPGSASGQVLVS